MFDNRFTRKDPLAESVRQVMIENDIRRQVELTLNEQLGIQSRKQLPHELHESYDATLNAAINNALNEGCSWSKGKMEEESEGSEPRNEKEHKLAAMKPPYNKITHADVLKGRGVIAQEEMNVALGKNPITRKDPKAPQAMQEKLTKKMSAGDVISDFVHSKNPKFAGKSKKERQRMALGAYYSKHPEESRKKMDESVQSILEEIRDNLQEQFVYVYENGNEAMMEQFLASLTEDQSELLGLSEANPFTNPTAAPARYQSFPNPRYQSFPNPTELSDRISRFSSTDAKVSPVPAQPAQSTAAQSTPAAPAPAATPSPAKYQSFPNTRYQSFPNPRYQSFPNPTELSDRISRFSSTDAKVSPVPAQPAQSTAAQSTPNADVTPPSGGSEVGINLPPSFRQTELNSMDKLKQQTAPAPVPPPPAAKSAAPASAAPAAKSAASAAPTAQSAATATKAVERPAPAERPQRQQRSSDSGSSFSGPTGRAGFGDRGSDFGG